MATDQPFVTVKAPLPHNVHLACLKLPSKCSKVLLGKADAGRREVMLRGIEVQKIVHSDVVGTVIPLRTYNMSLVFLLQNSIVLVSAAKLCVMISNHW